ncbi:MAG: InlB B-repeat-containing protein, partial [Treponema sp.]|nr:InlB B-repeat-containing protein [Treponema sp.]
NNETDAPPQTRRAVFGARLALADLPAPERTGHVLTGWNTRADGAGRGFTPAELAAEPITANLDLHAQWRLNRFTVILDQPLDAPAGSPSGEHQVIWGENLELRIPPPDSINFDGWWTQRIGGEQRSLQDMQYGDGDVIILYARWSIKFFRVTFDLNGGTQTGSVSLNQTLTGGASAAVPYPVRNGWIFTGWFTQADGGAQIQSFENVRANIAAVAGWRQSVAGLPWSPIRPNNDREGAPFSGFISSEEIQDLAFGEGSWVAVGGSGKISRSTNGRDFTLVPEGQRLANTRYSRLSVAFGDGWFISAGLGGEMLRSDDGGQNWRRPETSAGVFPSRTSILAVAWGGGGDFVIVGPGARMARSDNHGSTWNTVFSPALAQNFGEGSIRGVGFRRDNIVAVGTGGGIVYSKGANWNSARINPFGSTIINDLAFGVDSHGRPKWIAVGNDRKMAYSTDGGETWTEIFETGVFGDLNAIAYGDGTWVAVASNGTLSYSTNGETFIPVDHGVGGTTFLSSQRILGVAYADNRFYIVGDGGRMAYSVASPP